MLVTHDIDEAVRLGDRIAVLAEGGRLMQYAPPAELLSKPASPTVREFVGTDRGIRRLAVTPVRDAMRPRRRRSRTIERLPTVDVGRHALRRAGRDADRRLADVVVLEVRGRRPGRSALVDALDADASTHRLNRRPRPTGAGGLRSRRG